MKKTFTSSAKKLIASFSIIRNSEASRQTMSNIFFLIKQKRVVTMVFHQLMFLFSDRMELWFARKLSTKKRWLKAVRRMTLCLQSALQGQVKHTLLLHSQFALLRTGRLKESFLHVRQLKQGR